MSYSLTWDVASMLPIKPEKHLHYEHLYVGRSVHPVTYKPDATTVCHFFLDQRFTTYSKQFYKTTFYFYSY